MPEVFLIFQKIHIINALPNSSTLLRFAFQGSDDGNGGNGGDGGAGGNGARGTQADDGSFLGAPFCKAGPGQGGGSGKPGSGGRGGDAGRGENGANVIIVCPPSEKAKLAFSPLLQRGKPGIPGKAGKPGPLGTPGGGGKLSSMCRDGRPDGNQLQPNPRDLGPGQPAQDGLDGRYSVILRDNSDIFS